MTSEIDVDGYLRRLGLGRLAGQAPSVEGLFALHRAHAELIPYENLEIWLGRPTTVDPAESVARILRGRGGYCLHLNGAFSALLAALGYQVTRHFGGVQGRNGKKAGADGSHLVLTVDGLDGSWLADLGMGDGIHEPLPLTVGDHQQGPFRYGLKPSDAEPGGWRFDHDPRGSFLGMDFRAGSTEMSAFDEMHGHMSTAPESGFVRVAVLARRDTAGVDELRGLTLTRLTAESSTTVLDRRADYFTALADVFGLPLPDVTKAERDDLWRRLHLAHLAWLGNQ